GHCPPAKHAQNVALAVGRCPPAAVGACLQATGLKVRSCVEAGRAQARSYMRVGRTLSAMGYLCTHDACVSDSDRSTRSKGLTANRVSTEQWRFSKAPTKGHEAQRRLSGHVQLARLRLVAHHRGAQLVGGEIVDGDEFGARLVHVLELRMLLG